MIQYTFEQRNKINRFYDDINLSLDSFDVWQFYHFHIYDLDGIEGVNTAHCTPIERNIFCQIRQSQVKFLVEYRIGKYYADFCNPALKIVIEADGKQHKTQSHYDQERDRYFESLGFKVYRFDGCLTYPEYEDFLDEEQVFDESRLGEYQKTSEFFIKKLSRKYRGHPGSGYQDPDKDRSRQLIVDMCGADICSSLLSER